MKMKKVLTMLAALALGAVTANATPALQNLTSCLRDDGTVGISLDVTGVPAGAELEIALSGVNGTTTNACRTVEGTLTPTADGTYEFVWDAAADGVTVTAGYSIVATIQTKVEWRDLETIPDATTWVQDSEILTPNGNSSYKGGDSDGAKLTVAIPYSGCVRFWRRGFAPRLFDGTDYDIFEEDNVYLNIMSSHTTCLYNEGVVTGSGGRHIQWKQVGSDNGWVLYEVSYSFDDVDSTNARMVWRYQDSDPAYQPCWVGDIQIKADKVMYDTASCTVTAGAPEEPPVPTGATVTVDGKEVFIPVSWFVEKGLVTEDAVATTDFDALAQATGANGIPVWQSFVAGLEPGDPDSKLTVRLVMVPSVRWTEVPGRVYTVWWTDRLDTPKEQWNKVENARSPYVPPVVEGRAQCFFRVTAELAAE